MLNRKKTFMFAGVISDDYYATIKDLLSTHIGNTAWNR